MVSVTSWEGVLHTIQKIRILHQSSPLPDCKSQTKVQISPIPTLCHISWTENLSVQDDSELVTYKRTSAQSWKISIIFLQLLWFPWRHCRPSPDLPLQLTGSHSFASLPVLSSWKSDCQGCHHAQHQHFWVLGTASSMADSNLSQFHLGRQAGKKEINSWQNQSRAIS